MSKKLEFACRISFILPLLYIIWYIFQRVSNPTGKYILIAICTLLVICILAVRIREYVFDKKGKHFIGRGIKRNYYGFITSLILAGLSFLRFLIDYKSKEYHIIIMVSFLYLALISFFMYKKLLTIKRDVLIFHHIDLFGDDSQKIRIQDIEEIKIENQIVVIKTKDDEGYMDLTKILKRDRESVIKRFYQLKEEIDSKKILLSAPVS